MSRLRDVWINAVAVAAAAVCIGVFADAGRAQEQGAVARNPRLFAVPAPEGVSIDGKLDDWDRSGGIVSFPSAELRDDRRITTYAMYDEQAFYLAGRVRDRTPMMNRHDPAVTPRKAWDADAFQFRMYLKPRYPGNESKFADPAEHYEAVHMILWYFTDRQAPNLQFQYSMAYLMPRRDWPEGVVPRDRFDAAYRKWDSDGPSGYTFEYRIPWDTLSEEYQLRPGDVTAASLQAQWSNAKGTKAIGGAGWVKDLLRKPGFPFQKSHPWGKLIMSRHGDLPKGIAAAAEDDNDVSKPAPLSFKYELPRDGHVSLGLYDENNVLRRQLLAEARREQGTVTEQWDGLDDRGEPLPPGKYTWRGLVSDKITTEFILSVHNSGTPPYKTNDGTGGWGGDHGEPTTVAALGERMLLAWSMAESGWGIIRTDLAGDKQWGSKHSAKYLAVGDDSQRYFRAGGHGFSPHPGVRVYDASDSRPLNFEAGEPIAELPDGGDDEANTVTGVAAGGGRLYVSFAQRDLIAVNDAQTGALIETWNVNRPGRLALTSDGALLAISEQRLVKINDGNVRAFTQSHLDAPQGIAVDGDGRVYVTNQGALHNVSVFSPGGDYLKSIGTEGGRPRVGRFEPDGMLAPGGCAIDAQGRLWVAETLDRPKRISVWDTKTGENVDQFFGASSYFGWAWMDPEKPGEVYSHSTLWKVDLDERTKRVHSTIWRATEPNHVLPPTPGGFKGRFRVITADNGRQFGFGKADSGYILYMRDGDIFKPIAGVIRTDHGHFPALMEHERDWARQRRCFWQDQNDDQAVQPEEVTVRRKTHKMFHWVGSNLTAWDKAGRMLAPVRFEGDRPIYDFSQIEQTALSQTPESVGQLWFDRRREDGIYRLTAGAEHSFSKWTADGELRWSVGKRVHWRDALGYATMKPGDIWGMTVPLTLAGEFTGAASYFGGYHVFTRDGLYVAMLMRASRGMGGLGPDITASETVTGQLVKPTGMDRYFLLAGDQDGRITEVHGLDTVQRLEGGSITLSEKQVSRVNAAQRQYQAAQQGAGVLLLQRDKASLKTDNATISASVDQHRRWTAQLARDGKYLYAKYQVKSPAPFVNGQADPQVIFKGGNLMDIQLATRPAADPDREQPAPGDIRVLITRRKNGDPVAVLYRPNVKGETDEPIVLRSPTGTATFDVIRRIKNVTVDYETTDQGFTATARVPLAALDWRPAAGQTIKADLGYIFANEAGTRVSARSYWRNNSFTANVTDDIPHEARLQPHEWGTAVIE